MNLTEQQKLMLKGLVCPYCNQPSKLIDSEVIYGKSFGLIYLCEKCRAYVGVHKNTTEAKGRLANATLRALKKETHFYFDKIWDGNKRERRKAYAWLSRMLEIPAEYTHIGMFGEKTCKKAILYCKQFLNDMRRLDLDYGAEPQTEYFEI